MKIKAILLSMFAVAALASCSSDPGETGIKGTSTPGTAYMKIRVLPPATSGTRASSEANATEDESAITSLYAITFNSSKQVVKHTTETKALITLGKTVSGSFINPDAVKVSSSAKYLLVVANPGTKLLALLNGATEGMAWTTLNAAITQTLTSGDKPEVLVNEVRKIQSGSAKDDAEPKYEYFTMANVGEFTDASGNILPTDGLFAIATESMYVVGDGPDEYKTDEEAEEAANASTTRQKIGIERLAAKIQVNVRQTTEAPIVDDVDVPWFDEEETIPAKFVFGDWTLDVLNSRFYTYAIKTDIAAAHNDDYYGNNFYTLDPNFDTHTGLFYNQLNADLSPNVTWLPKTYVDYSIENTMKALEQKYKNATRVIIRAHYWPNENWTGDWFSYAGVDYVDLEQLQAAYAEAVAKQLDGNPSYDCFIAACDKFLAAVNDANGTDVEEFGDLDATTDLDVIEHGGELLKDDNCIRWYQGGLNYYFYEIRHDNTPTLGSMAYGKYGVVRNNYYSLTLKSVGGKGTPWYPNVDPEDPKPDPDPEPEPEEPIDDGTAWLVFELDVAPWVYWETWIDLP